MGKHQTTRPVLRGAAHLLSSLPYQFGYQPERSLVIVAGWLGPPSTSPEGRSTLAIEVTARVDLPEVMEHVGPVLGQVAAPLARTVMGRFPHRWETGPEGPRWDGANPPAMLASVFLYDADDELAAALLVQSQERLLAVGVAVHDLYLVRGSSYLPLVGSGRPGAGAVEESPSGVVVLSGETLLHTPADWEEIPSADEVPAVADWVLEGRNPTRRRGDIVDQVRARDERAAAATGLALTLLGLDPSRLDEREALRLLGRWVVAGETLRAKDRAAVAVTLADRTVRDLVLSRWVPQLFPAASVALTPQDRELRTAVPALHGKVEVAVQRLLELSAQLPEDRTAPVLTLAGCLAWWKGEGTLANEAIGLALEREPGYRMAMLIDEALARGISPRSMADAVAGRESSGAA